MFRFSVLNNLSFEELPSELFLKTCEDYFSLVGEFGILFVYRYTWLDFR